jgi:predicted phosphodiesterase
VLAVHHGSPASDTEYVTPYRPFPASVERFWAAREAQVLILGHTHIPMIGRGPRGTVINPGSVLRVPGVPTSYSFAVMDPEVLAVRLFDIRTGREIRRDPIVLVEQ